MNEYLLAFVPMFVAVDAIGMIPLFLGLTDGMSPAERRRLVARSTVTALCVSIGFLWIGKLLFAWLGITISDFLVAGGLILFVISIRDLLASGKPQRLPGETMGVVPLAVPLIAGPAVLTTSLILLNSYGPAPTLAAVVSNILLCGLVLRFASECARVLGDTGSHTLSKIASLLLGAIGVMLVRRGLAGLLGGAP